MAATQITFFKDYNADGSLPVVDHATADAKTTIVPSGSNQQTAAASDTTNKQIARVATDTAIYVSFGTNPNATSDTQRFLVPASAIEYFRVAPGSKAAVATI